MSHGGKKTPLLLCALLFVLTAGTYWSVLQNDFVYYDDRDYVTENPHVLSGLSAENLAWALGASHSYNWHPITWISHMLDVELYGLNPAGHHLTNLILHIGNALLLFLLLHYLTLAPWRSFFVAAFFALHPLHTESVAWVSERKDVLSTFFFLLTVLAYSRYARECNDQGTTTKLTTSRLFFINFFRSPSYLASLVLFALGLMSKPILVTTPFVLLLLDYWPLQRFAKYAGSSANVPIGATTSAPPEIQSGRNFVGQSPKSLLPLVYDKIPFAVLSALSVLITLHVQQQAIVSGFPLRIRIANAVVSYLRYLGKTIWPAKLAVFYPHPDTRYFRFQDGAALPASEQWSLWQILLGAVLLLGLCLFVISRRKKSPWFMTGWFWYLGTLVPVIGLIQAGIQGMADRYTYIPLIGVFILAVWGVFSLFSLTGTTRYALCLCAGLLLAACIFTTQRQVTYWRSNLTLFQHALNVTTNNSLALLYVGADFGDKGKLDVAEQHFRSALAADPYCYQASTALGTLFEMEGHTNQAIKQYETTLQMRPWDDLAPIRLAGIYRGLKQITNAESYYQRALRYNSDNIEANFQLGTLFLDKGDLENAGRQFAKTTHLNPSHVDGLLYLSEVREKQDRLPDATSALRSVILLYPTNSDLRVNLGSLLWRQGKEQAALAEYRESIRLKPANALAHYNAGVVLSAQNLPEEAVKEFSTAAQLEPQNVDAFVEWGWIVAQSGKVAESSQILRRALALNPVNSITWANLGSGLWAIGDTNQGAACISNAIRIEPGILNRIFQNGRALADRGQRQAALKMLERVKKMAEATKNEQAAREAENAMRLLK